PCEAGSYSFFFQAEDGIRDWSVTGVQTCALPILGGYGAIAGARTAANTQKTMIERPIEAGAFSPIRAIWRSALASALGFVGRGRSEERRVGKEWRCRWGGER